MSKKYQINEEDLLKLCEKAAFADFCLDYVEDDEAFNEEYFKDKKDIPNNIKEAIINNPKIAVEDIGYFKMLEYEVRKND